MNLSKQEIIESVKNTLTIESNEVGKLIQYADYDKIVETIDAIAEKKRNVLVSGCGTSAQIAKKIVHSLNCINITAFYLNPSDAVHGSIGAVSSDDIVIFISKGGNTAELTGFVENIRHKKAKIIYVGENAESVLCHAADIFLKVKVETEPDEYNMLATASSMSVLALFDAICIALMKRTDFTKAAFSVNHPQGAVGERLKTEK